MPRAAARADVFKQADDSFDIFKIIKVPIEKGHYLFKLEQLISDKGISKNKLMRDTNTDFRVIQRLARGEMVRLDIIVLARLCDYLQCDIPDIVEYVR